MSEIAAVLSKGNARSSGYARNADDWYQEPRRAIEELLDAEPFEGTTWDPAAGGGNIPEAFIRRGNICWASDIADRGYTGHQTYDFLGAIPVHRHPDNIVTNPPFSLATQFVLRALPLVMHKVAVLQRLTWLEGETRYQALFCQGVLARIWQFRSRISMPPGGSGAVAKGGSVAFAWFVFSRDHQGPPTLGWLP